MQPDDIVDAELVDGADPKPTAEPAVSRTSFIEQILSPQSLQWMICLLYTSPSPRDATLSRMPSSA